MLLNNEKELNAKYNEMLGEEEKKGQNSKEFINDLIKQKENLLKADLAKSETIIELQTKIHTLEEEISLIN